MTTTPNSPGSSNPGRYRFGELIATGGMGEVWKATDTALDRPVAIKLLKPEYADDSVNRQRFDSEARHAAALHHPHIAAVYDVGEMPTASGLMRPYLVMEYVDGEPLSSLLDGRPLEPEVVRDLLGQAGDAIAAAHRAGIVHRDLKPANLLITKDREVKVTDFGIARAASSSSITGTGQVMGTPQYLSPEQARGEAATAASDVYSLGIVAFECLVGHRPFQKETPVATAIAQIYDPVPPLPESVPADLRQVVSTALAKDPHDRYPDAAAFTAALRGLTPRATDTPPRGTPIGPGVVPEPTGLIQPQTHTGPNPLHQPTTTVVAAPFDAGDDATQVFSPGGPVEPAAFVPGQGEPQEPQRRNWLLIALLIAVGVMVLLIAFMAWFVLRGSDSDEPTTPTDNSSSSSPSPSATISFNPALFVSEPVDEVVAELQGMHLKPKPVEVPNDGTHIPDTVKSVYPSDDLARGDRVIVKYWGAAEPSESPTPTESESTEPTQSTQPSQPASSQPPSSTPASSTPASDQASGTTDQSQAAWPPLIVLGSH